jgi:hypothetical protein
MADWYGICRSNYFRVKDETSFLKWTERFDVEIIRDNADGISRFGFYSTEFHGGLPTFYDEEAEERGEDCVVSILDEISSYLADGETAVIQEAGAEKLRYVTGRSYAIHSSGEHVKVCIDGIYAIAESKFGGNITECSW